MGPSRKNKWVKDLAGAAALTLTFNLVGCQQITLYLTPSPHSSSAGENLSAALNAVEGYKPAACSTTVSPFPDATPPMLKRPLTEREFAFYTKFHGGSLDLNKACIHLHEGPATPKTVAAVAEGETNIISIFGRKNYSEDYTKEENPDIFGILASETIHLMQHQRRSHTGAPETGDTPGYGTLRENANLDEYSDPQKRALVEDYARFVFTPTSGTREYLHNCHAKDLLMNTVEKKYPGAAELRQAFERRKLTDPEMALVLGLFGGQIRHVDKMTVIHHAQCDEEERHYTVTSGSETEFHSWGRKYRETDYARGQLGNFGMFAHEIGHEWQNQHRHRYTGGLKKDYIYKLDAENPDFKSFQVEQQGSILEDYARYFLHREKNTLLLEHTQDNLNKLKKVVEDQFPMAKKTRVYFETHGKLPDLKTVRGWLNDRHISSVVKPDPFAPA